MESLSRDLPVEDQAKIDSVADEFEKACQSDQLPRLEGYLMRLPQLRRPLLRELLLIEVELRRKSGELPKLDDYIGRFAPEALAVTPLNWSKETAHARRKRNP